tara:strand:+ start:858 stop:1220 length:363 start_codon:yes stop_codon:yes gene_type:complete
MSVVTYFVETSQGYLDTAAETQFGSVAATVGTLLVLGTTLVVILVFLNMIYQYKAMDGRTAFWLAVKIGLIGIFATNWVQFNALSPPSWPASTALRARLSPQSVAAHQVPLGPLPKSLTG